MSERMVLRTPRGPVPGRRHEWLTGPGRLKKGGLWWWSEFGKLSTSRPSWMDHEFCFRGDNGETFYVSEPYDLGGQEIDELSFISRQGWDVRVDNGGDYQNGTQRVLIESKAQRRRREAATRSEVA